MPSHDVFVLLHAFRNRALPALLRKLQVWKGLDPRAQADLLEEMEQELWLDCLEHGETILALDERERHGRWFRLVEHRHYRLNLRSDRMRAFGARIEQLTGPKTQSDPRNGEMQIEGEGGPLSPIHRRFLSVLEHHASYMQNGRLNCRASARSLGMRAQDLARTWSEVAGELGFGPEFLVFWRRRLVEALTGLAADLLRDGGLVHILGEERRSRPDPGARLRRIRRVRDQLRRRPIPSDIKHVLSHYLRIHPGPGLCPHEVLADARYLAPENPGVQLWCFEAAVVSGDLAAAARALRAARRAGADRIAVHLGRARLLEARGAAARAFDMLARARQRSADARLRPEQWSATG